MIVLLISAAVQADDYFVGTGLSVVGQGDDSMIMLQRKNLMVMEFNNYQDRDTTAVTYYLGNEWAGIYVGGSYGFTVDCDDDPVRCRNTEPLLLPAMFPAFTVPLAKHLGAKIFVEPASMAPLTLRDVRLTVGLRW